MIGVERGRVRVFGLGNAPCISTIHGILHVAAGRYGVLVRGDGCRAAVKVVPVPENEVRRLGSADAYGWDQERRSEERRVGRECRSRRAGCQGKKKKKRGEVGEAE